MFLQVPRLAYLFVAIGLGCLSSVRVAEGQSAAAKEPSLGLDPRKPIHQYVHQSWTKDDGLPSNTIRDIAQTEEGYLWLATHAGLVRFDGARFKTFDSTNTPSLGTNFLTQLRLARDGTLWIGSHSGLIRFRDGEFSTVTTSDGRAGIIIQDMLEDQAGTLWIVADGEIHQLRGETLFLVERPVDVEEGTIRSVEASVDGTLWLSTLNDGVILKSENEWHHLTDANGLPMQQIGFAYLDQEESLWLAGTPSSPTWLARYRDGSVTDHSDLSFGRGQRVRAILESRNGALWIAAKGGLLRFYEGRFERYIPAGDTIDRRFISLFEDREGSLWTSTYGGGLQRFSEGPIITYAAKDGLGGRVMAILEDRHQNLWVGTDIGLHRLENGRFKLEVEVPSGVRAIAEARNGALWLGTNRALVHYASGELIQFPTGVPVNAVLEDREGRVWANLHDLGLQWFREGEFFPVEALADQWIRWIHEDPEGTVWVGIHHGGLGRLVGDRLTRITVQDGLSSDGVLSHLRDGSGVLWVGTEGGGLNRLEGEGIRFYSSRDGLHDDSIWPVLEDDRQNLWMGGDRGIFRVSKRDLADFDSGRISSIPVDVYGVEHGMKSVEGFGAGSPSGFRARDGRLWFATVAGAAVVDPEFASEGRPAPAAMIEEVLIDGEEVTSQADLRFPFGADELQIRFTAPTFHEPDEVQFQYRMDKLDRDWRNVGSLRAAFYSQVPPGQYRFRVRARRQGDPWSPEEADLQLTVLPRWWQTWWFRAVVVLAVVGLILGALRLRLRSYKRRNRELELEILRRQEAEKELQHSEQRTRQQRDELAQVQRIAAMGELTGALSHEIRQPLTAIRSNTQAALRFLSRENPDLEEIGEILEDIAGDSRRATEVLDGLRDLLQKHPVSLTPLDVNEVVEESAELLRSEALIDEIQVALDLTKGLPMVRADRIQLQQVLVNLLLNAFEAVANTPGNERNVLLRTRADDGGGLRVSVRDTGEGLGEQISEQLFNAFHTTKPTGLGIGLSISRTIIEAHGGRIWAENNPDRGATFHFALPSDLEPRQDPG